MCMIERGRILEYHKLFRGLMIMAGRNSCDPEMERRDPLSNYNPFPTAVKSVLNTIYSSRGL